MFARSLSGRSRRTLVGACGIAVLCVVSAHAAAGQDWNRRTAVTFSGPVEIPGVGAQVLPAGTYVFKLLDSLSNRHIVQIFNEDESHIYATILAIPNYRLRATDRTVMTFDERPAGEPLAIRAWFYPGDNSGQEFVYPKQRATELARITNEPVLAMPDAAAPHIIAAALTPTAPAVIALREAPVSAVTPAGVEIALSEVVAPPPAQTASLPRTAGGLPLLTLMGLLSVALGLSLKTLCVRR